MPRRPFIPPELTTGPFRIDDATRFGLSRHQLSGRAWTRLGGGVYALKEIANEPLVRLRGATQRTPDAVFSGPTAGWLHGIDLPPCAPIEVCVPPASSSTSSSGGRVRRLVLAKEDIVVCQGLRTTSALRTAADLGSQASCVDSVIALDMATHNGLVSLDELRCWAETHRGRAGVARLRRAIDLCEPATQSPMETRLRLILVLGGLPKPEVQVDIHDDDGMFLARVDLLYRDKRIAIEYDGIQHGETHDYDSRRQNLLFLAGYRVLRFTAPDVFRMPMAVVGTVRSCLNAPVE